MGLCVDFLNDGGRERRRGDIFENEKKGDVSGYFMYRGRHRTIVNGERK